MVAAAEPGPSILSGDFITTGEAVGAGFGGGECCRISSARAGERDGLEVPVGGVGT